MDSAYRRALDRVVTVLNGCAELATALMALTVVADVTCRFVLNVVLEAGAETVAYYFMVALTFLPLAHITREDGHLKAEFFTRGLSARGRAILEGIVLLVLFGFMAMLCWQTTLAAIDKTEVGEIIQAAQTTLQVWPARWVLPVGAAVMAIYALTLAVWKLTGEVGAAETKIEEF
jgi:TRAP-type C4-dicarboxylate transport system permease small subunit